VEEVCESPEMCNPTFCGECPNGGEVRCAATEQNNPLAPTSELQQCVPEVGWMPLDSCASEELCMRTVDIAMSDLPSFMGVCMAPWCEAGALRCMGNILQRCSQGQQMWNQVGPACVTPEVCQMVVEQTTDPAVAATLTMCPTPCLPPGGFRCDG